MFCLFHSLQNTKHGICLFALLHVVICIVVFVSNIDASVALVLAFGKLFQEGEQRAGEMLHLSWYDGSFSHYVQVVVH